MKFSRKLKKNCNFYQKLPKSLQKYSIAPRNYAAINLQTLEEILCPLRLNN